LAAADRDFEAAFDHLDRALSELKMVGYYPLDRGRTLLVLGSVRRQEGHKAAARAALEEALAIFDNLGARAWSSWALAELGRISGRRAASHDLTESELRVATLASQGLSNHEIGSALFMGDSTVEAHLSRVYGKLGVRRAGLGASLRDMQASRK
jgi:ATP/maltotriose-dependent transcriptional regulator MalT